MSFLVSGSSCSKPLSTSFSLRMATDGSISARTDSTSSRSTIYPANQAIIEQSTSPRDCRWSAMT